VQSILGSCKAHTLKDSQWEISWPNVSGGTERRVRTPLLMRKFGVVQLAIEIFLQRMDGLSRVSSLSDSRNEVLV